MDLVNLQVLRPFSCIFQGHRQTQKFRKFLRGRLWGPSLAGRDQASDKCVSNVTFWHLEVGKNCPKDPAVLNILHDSQFTTRSKVTIAQSSFSLGITCISPLKNLGCAKGAEKASCGEQVVQKGVLESPFLPCPLKVFRCF